MKDKLRAIEIALYLKLITEEKAEKERVKLQHKMKKKQQRLTIK